ncbi:MAG: caspase family protein [Pseudomonadota bacterium]
MVRVLLAAALVVIVNAWPAFAEGHRIALVIGNGAYQNGQRLINPVNDAKKMAAALDRLGFQVHRGYDLSRNAMEKLIRTYAKASENAEIALVYFAGHGMQVEGENYLLPVDAAPQDAKDLDFFAIQTDLLMRQVNRNTRYRIFILDACRDNPFPNTLGNDSRTGVGQGLAEMAAPDGGNGALIVFATDPGNVALDGRSDHSPFTGALLRHIETPGVNLLTLLTRVNRDVAEETNGRQRPWMSGSLTGEVFLAPEAPAAEPLALSAVTSALTALDLPDADLSPDLVVERDVFRAAQTSGEPADYQAYLAAYPEGHYAQIARDTLARLDNAPAPTIEKRLFAATTALVAAPAARNRFKLETGVASEATEGELTLRQADRRSIQRRLGLLGFDTGQTDGVPGPNTRRALSHWQEANGFYKSGYLNLAQYEELLRQSERLHENWLDEQKQRLALTRSLAEKHATTFGSEAERTPVGRLKEFFNRNFPVTEEPGPVDEAIATE